MSNSELKGVIAGASLVTGQIPQKTVSMVKAELISDFWKVKCKG